MSRRDELIEERDFLLRSLDDLDAELAAGDLDAEDHAALRDDYTRRAADVIRRLEGMASETTRRPMAAGGDRRWLGFVVAGVFALGAGFLLARSVGERGVNDQITGSIEPSSRTRTRDCLELANGTGNLESIQCLDAVVADDPTNAEAWSYSGWFVALTGFSAADAGDTTAAAELLASAEGRLDEAVAADPDFPDAYAFRAVLASRRGDHDRACGELSTLLDLNPPPFVLELVSTVDLASGCELIATG